jgi:hypothetical protein
MNELLPLFPKGHNNASSAERARGVSFRLSLCRIGVNFAGKFSRYILHALRLGVVAEGNHQA